MGDRKATTPAGKEEPMISQPIARHSCKRISDQVFDTIVARVLGLEGLPQPSDVVVAEVTADVLRRANDRGHCSAVVREVVNGALRAARFVHLPIADAARATMLGIIQGARKSRWKPQPYVTLASQRLLWSTAALGEELPACARGVIEGVGLGDASNTPGHSPMMELVIAQLLAAVEDIDDRQTHAVRREIATVAIQR
jgi:hypothetical protein